MNERFNRHMNYDFKDNSLISFTTSRNEIHCISLKQLSLSFCNSSAIIIAKDDEIILSYDIYVYNESYSLLLYLTNQSIQYSWISSISDHPLSSNAASSIVIASNIGASSCIRWIPQANCFLVFTKDSYYYSNTIVNKNSIVELNSSKIIISSEIGQQSRLICKDNNVCVEIYLIHYDTLDVILMLKNKDTGLYSIQYCELKPVDNNIEIRWGYSIADDVIIRPLPITTPYNLMHEVGNASALVDKQHAAYNSYFCFYIENILVIANRNGIVDQIDLHPHINGITGLCMNRYQVASVPTGVVEVSLLVSCMNELFYQLDFLFDHSRSSSSNTCQVQQIYKKYYSSINRLLDLSAFSVDSIKEKDLEILLPSYEYLIALPVYGHQSSSSSSRVIMPCAFIGVHSKFGVQVLADVSEDMEILGYTSEEQYLLRCLARLPQLNHISNIKQLIALDATTHSNMCIEHPTIPQHLIAYCGNDWTSVLYRVSTQALLIYKNQDFIIDAVSYDDMQIISTPIQQQRGNRTSLLLMLTSISANQSCLININSEKDHSFAQSGISELQCNVEHCNYIHDQVTVNLFHTSHGTIQITKTSLCLIPSNDSFTDLFETNSSLTTINSITTLKDLIRKSSKYVSFYDIASSGQIILKSKFTLDKALDDDSVITIYQSVCIANTWLILACGQMLFVIQIGPSVVSYDSKHGSFVLKAIYYTSSAISSLSSCETQSLHHLLSLSFWNLEFGLQIFEMNELKYLELKHRLEISPSATTHNNNNCIRHICMLSRIFSDKDVSITGIIFCQTDGSLSIYELIENKTNNARSINLVRSWKVSKGIRYISRHTTEINAAKVSNIIIESFDGKNYMISYTASDPTKARMLIWDCNMIACTSSLHRGCFYPCHINDTLSSKHQGVLTVGWLEKQSMHANSMLRLCVGDISMQPHKYCHVEKKAIVPGVINNLQLVHNSSPSSSSSYALVLCDQSMLHYSIHPSSRLIPGLGFPVVISGLIALYDSFTLDCIWKQTIEQGICGSHMLLTALSFLDVSNQDYGISITWIYSEMQAASNDKLLKGIGINTTILDMNPDINDVKNKLKCINYFSLDITSNILITNILSSSSTNHIINNSTTSSENPIALLSEIERHVEIEEQKQDMDAKKVQSTHSHIRILPHQNLLVICTSSNALYLLRYQSSSINTKHSLEIDHQMNTTHTGAVVDVQLCSSPKNDRFMNNVSQVINSSSSFSSTSSDNSFRMIVSIALCGIEIYTGLISQENKLHVEYTYFIDCTTTIWTNIQVHQEYNCVGDHSIEDGNTTMQLLYIERICNKLQSAKVSIPTDYQLIQGIPIQCQLNHIQLPKHMSAQDIADNSSMISYTVTSNMVIWNKFGEFHIIT